MPLCQQLIVSGVTKRERTCRNPAFPGGTLCRRHARQVGVVLPEVEPRIEGSAELRSARIVVEAARQWLNDPTARGRFVSALGDYDVRFGRG